MELPAAPEGDDPVADATGEAISDSADEDDGAESLATRVWPATAEVGLGVGDSTDAACCTDVVVNATGIDTVATVEAGCNAFGGSYIPRTSPLHVAHSGSKLRRSSELMYNMG